MRFVTMDLKMAKVAIVLVLALNQDGLANTAKERQMLYALRSVEMDLLLELKYVMMALKTVKAATQLAQTLK